MNYPVYGHTVEDIIIRIDEDDRILRLKAWKKLLDNFFFNLYINDDYLLSSFCKLKYLENKDNEQLNIVLDLSKEEIKFIDTKIKTFIYKKAKSLYLYDEVEIESTYNNWNEVIAVYSVKYSENGKYNISVIDERNEKK